MKLKAFLFTTAIAVAATSPAAAADLSVAEPVDYVRVCDAFGSGYWYVPGTDTCIRIGGYVRFDVRAREAPLVADSHTAYWDFRSRGRLNFWASSETDYGTLTGFVRLQGTYDNTSSSNGVVSLDRAWLSLGHLLAGYETSTFDYAGGYTLDTGGYRSDQGLDQIRISKKFDAVSLALAVEDGRDRNAAGGVSRPDVVGTLAFAQGAFDAKVSAAYVDQWTSSSGYALQLGASLKLDEIAKGDAVRLVVGYAKDAGSYTGALGAVGSTYGGGTSWNVLGSAQHFWASNFSTAVTASYVSAENGTSAYAWQTALSAAWVPVKNLTVGGEVNYNYRSNASNPDTWTALLRLQREIQ